LNLQRGISSEDCPLRVVFAGRKPSQSNIGSGV
jgi:hypothetical protein